MKKLPKFDADNRSECSIEQICHDIFDEYTEYAKHLEKVRIELLKVIERFPGVHLQTIQII